MSGTPGDSFQWHDSSSGRMEPFSHQKTSVPCCHHPTHASDGCNGRAGSAGHTVTHNLASSPSLPSADSSAYFDACMEVTPLHILNCAFLDLKEKTICQLNNYTAAQPHVINIHQVKMTKPILPQMTQNAHFVILPTLGICPCWNCSEKISISCDSIKIL